MLRTTRFCVWSYRWAVPAMVAAIFLISLINLTGTRAKEGLVSYIISTSVVYMVLIPLILSVLQTPQTVRFALTMGQTRRSLWAELPCVTLAFTLFLDTGLCAAFAVQCRLFLGQWVPGVCPRRLCAVCSGQHCVLCAGAAGGAFGPPVRRPRLAGRPCGPAGADCGGRAGCGICALFCAAGHGAAVFRPARTWAAVGASVLGALVVCGAVQAASWLILRRICVK